MISDENEAWRTGEDNYKAVMTNAQVRAARFLRADYKLTVEEIARMYRCSRAAASNFLSGKTYPEAGGPLTARRAAPGSRSNGRRSHRSHADVKS
jgi:hypothetical protein